MFPLIEIPCIRFNSGIEISDSALGPSHPRRKLVFLNPTFGEAVDQIVEQGAILGSVLVLELYVRGFIRGLHTSDQTAISRILPWTDAITAPSILTPS
ncbi:MAG TPA: hypothetical protein VEK33_15645 [Terriglobales bacterium]|nr:hypothetical protein [Terriglobales bacterium]